MAKGGVGVKRASLLGHLRGDGENEEVPDCIYKGSKEEVSAFLSRLFDNDGWIAIKKKGFLGRKTVKIGIGYGSSSIKLIDGVKHLLLKFGIRSYTIRSGWINHNSKRLELFELIISEKDCINKFSEEISVLGISGFSAEAVSKKENSNDKNTGSSDIRWDTIKSVKCVGNKKTVDLEVNPNHIIGGDIISHNTILASVISAYEVYKLLVIGNGDPHKFYNLPADDEIAVINVALSEKQAGRLFTHIQSRLRNGPFFKGRIAKETTTEIRLYTDSDLKKKSKDPILSVPGSILILCGHSNPDSLAGYNTILILFDELAAFDDSGKVTGEYFYTHLKPALSHFYKYGDGRLVEISSPSSASGVFYRIHKESEEFDDILSFQLPTWDANPEFDYNHRELVRDRQRNPEAFAIEYGAQWARSGIYGNYFPEGLVDRCIMPELHAHDSRVPGFNYYMHVDPANGGDRYAAVLVGAQRYVDVMGNRRWRVVLANIWIWEPEPGIGLLFNRIDQDVIQKCSIFHPLCVSYDTWESISSIQSLRSHGINCTRTAFNNSYKMKIYQNLTDMMSYSPMPELLLYDDPNLILEMKCLKKRIIKRGVSILADKHGEMKTDDIVDCLAGAASMASGNVRMPLPAPVTVNMGFR